MLLTVAYFVVWLVLPGLGIYFDLLCMIRRRCVRGSRLRMVLDRRIVRMRPFLRPLAVAELALTVLAILQFHDSGYWFGWIIFACVWHSGGFRREDDDDDPWGGIKGLAKRLRPVPPHAARSTA